MTGITTQALAALARWDTPTICNALEVVCPERRGHGFTKAPFSCLYPEMAPIVGLARTVQIRAAEPDMEGKGSLPDRVAYYEYAASGEMPKVMVIEDIDPVPGTGAFWGEVHTAVHKGLGALGVVTNGSYRDVADSAPGFQVLGGMLAPSHAYVRPAGFGEPVTVHGMEVQHDDVIHADCHGAVVIPANAVAAIPEAVERIARREAVILGAARAPDFDIEKLKAAIGKAQDVH
ncbi:MAG: RraA family protein [Paracoccaceae bacterium]|nr:RraA family protein [Paracoccaceae bacterium]